MKLWFINKWIIVVLVIHGCSTNEDNNILLHTGDYKLTVADYNFLKSRHKNHPFDVNQIIENAYIIAYAMDNRYDTISGLSKMLHNALCLYSSDVDGFVWNKKVKPFLKVSPADIKDVYEKRSIACNLEYIYFPDSTHLRKYIPSGISIKTLESFHTLKQRTDSVPEIKYAFFRNVYPFYPFGIYTSEIANAKKGDVIGPFEALNGYYVLKVIGMETASLRPFEEEKPKIEKELIDALAQKHIIESQRKVLSSMSPKIHDFAVNLMASKFIANTKEWPEVDRNMALMDYTFNGKTYRYTAADFMDFVHFQPMYIGSPAKAADMKQMMKTYLMGVWYLDEAKNMGAETDVDFQLFKKYYMHKLFLNHYNKNNIYPYAKVSSDDLKRYYNENRDNLIGFETAVATVYTFSDQQSAFSAMTHINQHYNQKLPDLVNLEKVMPKLPGFISTQKDMKIQIADTIHSTMLINAINRSDAGKVLSPIKVNAQYWIIYLINKEGHVPMPYNYIKEDLELKLHGIKIEEVRNQLLAEHKTRYTVEINRIKSYHQKLK